MNQVIKISIKLLIVIIPLFIFGFLLFKNFQPTGAIVVDLKENSSVELSPSERIVENNEIKELSGGLVYFDSIVPERANYAKLRVWFKDNFPELSKFSIGIKDKKEWSYAYKKIFETGYDKPTFTPENIPEEFEFESKVYNPLGIELNNEPKLEVESINEKIIQTAIRGKHEFYAYLNGYLYFEVEKRDLNWYDGEDELKIKLYKDEDLLDTAIIEDDGITIKNQNFSRRQEGILTYENLEEGVYRIELDNNDDMIITKIKTNAAKMVSPRIFLADNEAYDLRNKNITIHAYLHDSVLHIVTYHKEGLQKVRVNNQEFNFDIQDKGITLNFTHGFNFINLEKGDVILSGNKGSFFSFDEESYFHPILFYETNNPKEADYIIIEEIPENNVKEEDGWLNTETWFNLNEAYINEKRELSFVFNTPHLNKNETKNFTIPIKKIQIEYFRESLIKR